MKTLEDYFFIGLILLEEFVKRTLIRIHKLYMKFDYWNFNRNLEQRNIELAKKTPMSK